MTMRQSDLQIEIKNDMDVKSSEKALMPKKIHFEDRDFTKEEYEEIEKLLLNNQDPLRELTFDNCTFKFKTIGKPFLEALKVVSSTLSLTFTRCKLDEPKIISEIIASNANITSLGVTDKTLNTESAIAISEALKVNQKLTELSVAYNEIGDQGAKAILDSFDTNKTLLMCWTSFSPMKSEIREAINKEMESRQKAMKLWK